jgi:type II secretory pathway component PulF
MNLEDFGFFNQQLAGMLRSGIPLEGALKELCRSMRTGRYRAEFELLEKDLARGTPLKEAVAARRLPELYIHMVQAGARSNDLPGVLILLADYYQRAGNLVTRLKGLLIYPLLVLATSLGLSILVASIYRNLSQDLFNDVLNGFNVPTMTNFMLWLPVVVSGGLLLLFLLVLTNRSLRQFLYWQVSPFKDAGFARIASTLELMLKGGTPFAEAVELLADAERENRIEQDLRRWHALISGGTKKFSDIAHFNTVFTPLFIWIVASAGEDLAAGFGRAAAIYHSRAIRQSETLLYSALPLSILILGFTILLQMQGLVPVYLRVLTILWSPY